MLTQQTGRFVAAAETINVDTMLMEQIHVEIAEWSRVFQHGVSLMPVSAARNDGGKIVTKVFRGISKITANHNGCVVKQGSLTFFNLIKIVQKMIQMFHEIPFDTREFFQGIFLAPMM